MNRKSRLVALCLALVVAASAALAQKPAGDMAFTVSMGRPSTHYYHVVFRCEGLTGETQDFKLPSWTPGFYQIMDYARNILNFQAEDRAGNPLPWEKTAKNAWRVRTGRAGAVTVHYDVYAFNRFVADSFLDDSQGFISPASVFMHAAGQLDHPVTVSISPYPGWSRVATGLDPVEGRPFTFSAPDFDVLYDCPILVGDLEVLPFEVRGVPHTFAGVNLGDFDRAGFVSDLKRIIEASAELMGGIPYRRYAFISIGEGRGGLEHANSAALSFDGAGLNNPEGRKRWLSFVCHEYFHLFNVKRIRPIALGPFDYDKENYTKLLWVAEGFTVYYEGLILKRAGLFTKDDLLRQFQASIRGYENSPGRLFQSAAASSFDTWLQSFMRTGNAANTTISYYDKGAALGMLIDLKIRNESKNQRSLDDVMRFLYRTYDLQKKRGFTDLEFRRACEDAAGASLSEVFEYASTVKDIDYRKYLAYAGLDIDIQPGEKPGAWFGASTRDQEGTLVISGVEGDSPASHGGLSLQDEVIALDGSRVNAQTLKDILGRKKPGEMVKVLAARRGSVREFEVVLGEKLERSFDLRPIPNPNPLQGAILKDWLKD
jgi:predicted metalloprotease with PDZ domain